jgi:hypothetical protein
LPDCDCPVVDVVLPCDPVLVFWAVITALVLASAMPINHTDFMQTSP